MRLRCTLPCRSLGSSDTTCLCEPPLGATTVFRCAERRVLWPEQNLVGSQHDIRIFFLRVIHQLYWRSKQCYTSMTKHLISTVMAGRVPCHVYFVQSSPCAPIRGNQPDSCPTPRNRRYSESTRKETASCSMSLSTTSCCKRCFLGSSRTRAQPFLPAAGGPWCLPPSARKLQPCHR